MHVDQISENNDDSAFFAPFDLTVFVWLPAISLPHLWASALSQLWAAHLDDVTNTNTCVMCIIYFIHCTKNFMVEMGQVL